MNKKTKTESETKMGRLSFKREAIRTLNPSETREVMGGMTCQDGSCGKHTCPTTTTCTTITW